MNPQPCPLCGNTPHKEDRRDLYLPGPEDDLDEINDYRWRYVCYYEGENLEIIRHCVSTCWNATPFEATEEWNRFVQKHKPSQDEIPTQPHQRHG